MLGPNRYSANAQRQRHLLTLLSLIIQEEEEEGRKRYGVILVSWTGKDRDSKIRKSPTSEVNFAETEEENQC